MDEIGFIFQTSTFDVEKLLPQVSRGLEKRMRAHQQSLPKLFRRAAQKRTDNRYDQAAREFLEGHAEDIKAQELQFCFSDEEMITVKGALEDLDQDAVTYDAVEFVMEGDSFFLVIYQGRGIILQKKDLTLGTVEEFRDFANRNIRPILSLEEE